MFMIPYLKLKNAIKFIFTINLLLMSNLLWAQNENYNKYYEHIIKAEIFSAQNQYESAIKEYNQAFLKAYAFPDDVIEAIKLNQKLNNHAELHHLLNLLVESGYKPNNEVPLYIEEENQYLQLLQPTHIAIPEYKNHLDSLYNISIALPHQRTDVLKDNYLSVFKTLEFFITYSRKFSPIDEDESKSIYLQEVLWSSTKDLLLNLYYSGQDISRQITDSWNDDLLINCLIHSAQITNYKKEEYKLFLLAMVQQGNLHPYQYAIIIDDVERRMGNEQIYGTITDPIEFDGDIEKYRNTQKQISTIKNIKEVDQKRKEIFLPPLWVTAQKYNFKLPSNYKAS